MYRAPARQMHPLLCTFPARIAVDTEQLILGARQIKSVPTFDLLGSAPRKGNFILHYAFCIPLQAGVDVCCNVPNVILQCFVAFFQLGFHLADGEEDSGMVPGEFFANIG